MLDLSSYLEKFKQFRNPGDEKEKIAKIILETALIEVKPSEIELKGQILYLKTSPIVKTELFMQKEEILNILKQRLDKQISDIR